MLDFIFRNFILCALVFKVNMEILFYVSIIFGIISQINGVHPIVSARENPRYRDISRLGERTGSRIASRGVLPSSRTSNREMRWRGRVSFTDRRMPIFHQPRPDTIGFRTFLRNYQELQNRHRSPVVLPQPQVRPLVFRPPLNFRKKSPTMRQFDLRKPSRVEHNNKHTLFHPPMAKISVPPGDGLKTAEKNSLLTLLEERKSVIRDDNDLILIRKHLIEINNLGSTEGLTEDQVLEKQVEYIENITDIDIQREVLKIFVKDIVEKSGFLSQNVSSVHDIDTLKALVDKISSVTDKFTKLSEKHAIDSLRLLKDAHGVSDDTRLNVASTTIGPMATSTVHVINTEHVTDSEHSLRQKILNALSIYDKHARVTQTPINVNDKGKDTFQSRKRLNLEPTAGMSIFGDVTTETSTSNSQTVENKRGM